MEVKKFIIDCFTNWCGEENSFAAFAEDELDLNVIAAETAYENFLSYSGFEGVLEEMFPDEEEYTDEMIKEAEDNEGEYYYYTIREVDEDDEDMIEEFNSLDLIYDCRD